MVRKNIIYCITDASGNIATLDGQKQVYSFDPWGRRRNATTWTYNNVPHSFLFDRGFTGQEHLDVFGLINLNGRSYDPWLGRFLSTDPIVDDLSNTQRFNSYTYANNNPMRFTDPTGYDGFDDVYLGPGMQSWVHPEQDGNSGFYGSGGGGGGGGGSSNGYHYDWATGHYEDSWGNVVSWNEVYNNYVLPNSIDITNLVLSPRSSSNKNSKGNGAVENANHIIDFAGVMVSIENWLEGLNGNLGAFVNGFKAIDQDLFLSGEFISGAQFVKDIANGNYNDAIGPELDMFMMYAMEYGGEAGLMIGGAYFIGKIAYQIYSNYSPSSGNLDIIQPLNPADNTNMIIPYMPLPALAPNPYQNIELIQGTVHYNYR